MNEYVKAIAQGKYSAGEVFERLQAWPIDARSEFIENMKAAAIVEALPDIRRELATHEARRLFEVAKRLEAELLPAADEGNQPPTSQEPRALELPSELDTEQARKYFARAIAAGYMKVTATGGKWLMKPDKSLGYFCGKVYKESKPQTALARYFHVPNIGALITQTGPGYEVTRADAKRWRAKIDKEIFFD